MHSIIEQQIYKFLETNIPEVIALKGPWGAGKTFTWNKFFGEAIGQGKVKFNKYSYVSLFGINSLDELKFAIFEEAKDISIINKNFNTKNILSRIKALRKKAFPIYNDISDLFGFGDATLRALAFSSLNKTIICIDDFERKGNTLNAQDVLGLISQLKEQKNCKVILILNDEVLTDTSIIDYQKYREKVIDIELDFVTSSQYCTSIALGDDEVSKKLKEHCNKLNINNIRVIKKIERFSKEILPLLHGLENEVIDYAIKSIVLFTWSFYAKDSSVPDTGFIKEYNYLSSSVFAQKKIQDKQSDNHAKWEALLRKYDYSYPNDLDIEISNIIFRGFVIEDNLKQKALKINEEFKAHKAGDDFFKAWRIFHDSFDDNEKDVINSLYSAVERNFKHIGLGDLNAVAALFRNLGYDDKANELIEFYLSKRIYGIDYNINNYLFNVTSADKYLNEKLKEVLKQVKPKRSLLDVLDGMSKKSGWNIDEEDILANTTSDEFYRFFKETKGEKLSKYIDICLDFGNFASPTENHLKIFNNVRQALKRIYDENALNKRRLIKFNLKFD